jgi:hypothetical protein
MTRNEHNYWLVGAAWGGTDHQDERFISEGFWMLGWEDGAQPERASQIRVGDRIAIKRMKGKGKTGIKIMHIGIVQGVILDTTKVICTVKWCATNLERSIAESKGCFQSIHGPYTIRKESDWLRQIFHL